MNINSLVQKLAVTVQRTAPTPCTHTFLPPFLSAPDLIAIRDKQAFEMNPADNAVPPVDYEKLFEEIKTKSCRVDRIDRAYEAQGRKPLRTRSQIIDRELEVRGSESLCV